MSQDVAPTSFSSLLVNDGTPLIGVVEDKRTSGIYALKQEGARPQIPATIKAACEAAWTCDAHLTCYFPAGPEGLVEHSQGWPRINKMVSTVISEMQAHGCDLLTQVFAFDFDLPKHRAWIDQQDVMRVFEELERIGAEDQRIGEWAYFYTTRGGARIIYILDKPMQVGDAESAHRWMVSRFRDLSDVFSEGNLVEERSAWYYPDDELRGQILAGWAQFERDLAAYVLPAPAAEPVTATPVESLPAVAVRMDGALVVQSNLPAFGAALRAFVERVPKRPSTDQEFADADAACKALKRAEEALDAAEANALASLSDVEAMRRMVAEFRNLARETRLASEKMVERRKLEIKEQAVLAARQALDLHIAVVNAEIAPMRIQPVAADFAGAIKGKRSVASMQDALDTTLAAAKIAADTQGRAIRANVTAFNERAAGLEFLFADLGALVHKPADDFVTLVDARIATHRAAEAERQRKADEAEAARIAAAEQRAREQEAARIAQEQAAAAEAQRRQEAAAAEAQRQAAAALEAAQRKEDPAPVNVAGPLSAAPHPAPGLAFDSRGVLSPVAASSQLAEAEAMTDVVGTLTMGMICERLGFTVSADFLSRDLHVRPSPCVGRRPGRYTEAQFQTICRQLVSHVGAMAELYAGEVTA